MKLSPSDRERCIAQFMACAVHGPEWKLPSLERKDGIVAAPMPRRHRYLTHNGKTQPLYVWSAETGLPPCKIAQRIDRHHWTIDKALTVGARV